MNGCCYYEIAMQSFISAATSDVGQMLQLMLQLMLFRVKGVKLKTLCKRAVGSKLEFRIILGLASMFHHVNSMEIIRREEYHPHLSRSNKERY